MSSDSVFRSGDVSEEETFIDDVFSYVSSALGFQKKERSVMGFVRQVAGDEMTFLGGAIQSEMTC